MAKQIVAQATASSQPIPAELEEYLQQAHENNISLNDALSDALRAATEQVQDIECAIGQAYECRLLTVSEMMALRFALHEWLLGMQEPSIDRHEITG